MSTQGGETQSTDGNWADLRPAVSAELARLQEDTEYASQSQFESAKHWRLVHWLLGIPAAGLAATAGFTGLATVTGRVPAAVLALVAALFGAVLTVVEPNKRAQQARAAGVGYNEIRVVSRQLRTIELFRIDLDQAVHQLHDLTDQKNHVDRIADLPNRLMFRRARKNIEEGRLGHVVDHEPASPGAER
jgi:hypothetical protein